MGPAALQALDAPSAGCTSAIRRRSSSSSTPARKFTVGAFWLYRHYDAFVQGDAPIVTAQMKGGAVDFIRADVNPPK